MSDAKRTTGPWAVDLNAAEHGQHAVNEATPGGGRWKAIATVHLGRLGGGSAPVQPDEAEANARLIAAAPELLAACLAMVASNMGQPGAVRVPALDAMRDAIGKATGKPDAAIASAESK